MRLRSRLFSRLAREITVAARQGDPDPEKNPRLRAGSEGSEIEFGPEGRDRTGNLEGIRE